MWLGQHDLDIGLAVGGQGDPTEPPVLHLVLDGQTQCVPIEAESGIRVIDVYVHGAE
jgi:hypothetical protein